MIERWVVDTNVVVAGLLTREPTAPTRLLLDAMLAGRRAFLLSEWLLVEYRMVLLRPKIVALDRLTEAEVDEVLLRLAANAMIAGGSESGDLSHARGASGDEHLLEILESVPGAVLVTGDLPLARRVGRRAKTPREALANS